jgi:hypothetical protein
LSSVNGFLDQAKADMRNRGVHAMLCPVSIVSTRRNSNYGKNDEFCEQNLHDEKFNLLVLLIGIGDYAGPLIYA